MTDIEPSVLRRPNGRFKACDPCKSRKIACDHVRPVCSRCRKRKQENDCVYTETAPRSKSSRRTARSVSTPTSASPIGSFPQLRAAVSTELIPRNSTSRPGYLGSTSHSTVFEETRRRLSLVHGSDSGNAHTNAGGTTLQRISFRDLPTPMREKCLIVLRCLPGQSNEQMVFRDNVNRYEGWTHIAVTHIVRSLQENFGEFMDRDESKLELMAEMICSNTANPIQDYHSGPQQWMAQFCGQNLRWESLGLLWAYLERISDTLDALKTRRLDWISGKNSPEMAVAGLGYCIDISRYFTEANDLLLDLCRRKGTLESITEGDASKFRITRMKILLLKHSRCIMLDFTWSHSCDDDLFGTACPAGG